MPYLKQYTDDDTKRLINIFAFGELEEQAEALMDCKFRQTSPSESEEFLYQLIKILIARINNR